MPAEDEELVLREAVSRLIESGRAKTAYEAEEIYLNEWLDEYMKLVGSSMTNEELEAHPFTQLLLRHGTGGLCDSSSGTNDLGKVPIEY